jgi:thiol-disulfide isomerase/thioredoxin
VTSEAIVAPPPKGRSAKWVWWLVGVLLVGGIVALAALESSRMGVKDAGGTESAAPTVVLKRHGGGTLNLAELKGQVVMLDFWATWCPPCKAEMPSLVKLAKEYEAQGLAFVAVSQDEEDVAEYLVGQFMDRYQPDLKPYVAYGNDAVAEQFKVEALPTLFFLDREGKVLSKSSGMMDEQEMRNSIEAALRQQ